MLTNYNTLDVPNPFIRRSNEQSVQIEDLANDIQYLLQAFSGIEDRLTKLEASACLDDINLIKTPKETGESFRVTDTNNFQLNMILGSSSFFFIDKINQFLKFERKVEGW